MRHLAANQPLLYHPRHTQWTRSVTPYTTFLTPLHHFLLDLRCLPGHRCFSVVCLLLSFFCFKFYNWLHFFWSQILSLTGTDFLFYFYDMHRTGKWTTRLRSKRKFSAHLQSALAIRSWYCGPGGWRPGWRRLCLFQHFPFPKKPALSKFQLDHEWQTKHHYVDVLPLIH